MCIERFCLISIIFRNASGVDCSSCTVNSIKNRTNFLHIVKYRQLGHAELMAQNYHVLCQGRQSEKILRGLKASEGETRIQLLLGGESSQKL